MKADPIKVSTRRLANLLDLSLKGKQVTFRLKNDSARSKGHSLLYEIESHGIVNYGGEPQLYLRSKAFYWHEPVTGVTYVLTDGKLVLTGRVEQTIATIDLT
jgi:hypothetical protein